MARLPQNLTFQRAAEMLTEAGVVEGKWSIGTNATLTEINIPAGSIGTHKNGFFKRSDVCRLIGYAQLDD